MIIKVLSPGLNIHKNKRLVPLNNLELFLKLQEIIHD